MSDCGGYDWGEAPGIQGPVLLCGTHGLPAWGEAYELLDKMPVHRITTTCQGEEAPVLNPPISGPD